MQGRTTPLRDDWANGTATSKRDSFPPGEAPYQGLDLYAKLAEFVQPKLARTEHSGEVWVRGRLVISD